MRTYFTVVYLIALEVAFCNDSWIFNLFSTTILYKEHHFHELKLAQWCITFRTLNALQHYIYVKHPNKRVRMSQKREIFVDLNRTDHDKSVQMFLAF